MSRHALSLPLRTLAPSTRSLASQWTCRRCLATQTDASSGAPTETVPANYDPTLPFSQRIGPDGKHYSLKKSDRLLKKPLKQRLPPQFLQHSTSEILHESERAMRDDTVRHKKIVGVVVNSGKMDKTVTVRINGQKWNTRIRKMFPDHIQHLVHDPNNSLVTGDVVELHRLKVSRKVEHVVASIVSPFGTPIESRAPIPTADERLAAYKEYRFKKLQRRELRVKAAEGKAEAIRALKKKGLNPGAGVEEGVGQLENAEYGDGQTKTPSEGAILGEKGQKLPEGVLPGGMREVGKIDDWSAEKKAEYRRLRAEESRNLSEAKEKEAELNEQDLETRSTSR
ncbi:unnamed protein product [Zymoseptoria tritici ST99CH_3D7]|uniref:Nucleic acid-binding protein n=1 Tax=Zymoseptoria tritici (strain ST99CH_3D7) TaxID=1276538 RepID=A0A1X7RVW7_ZYMT9|nr:unnamed protein product [Zymoseptoria tritici ST99CH_3D7]